MRVRRECGRAGRRFGGHGSEARRDGLQLNLHGECFAGAVSVACSTVLAWPASRPAFKPSAATAGTLLAAQIVVYGGDAPATEGAWLGLFHDCARHAVRISFSVSCFGSHSRLMACSSATMTAVKLFCWLPLSASSSSQPTFPESLSSLLRLSQASP